MLSAPDEWVERDLRPRFPAIADKAMEAYAIFRRAEAGGALDPADLCRLEEFCADRSTMLRDWAAAIVGELSASVPAAAELLVKLAQSRSGSAAVAALVALHHTDHAERMTRVAALALRHRSKTVRELAACKIQRFRLRGALAELDKAVGVEADPDCKQAMLESFLLLRDGHIIASLESGAVYIAVAGPRSVVGQRFSADEVGAQGVEQLIHGLKRHAASH